MGLTRRDFRLPPCMPLYFLRFSTQLSRFLAYRHTISSTCSLYRAIRLSYLHYSVYGAAAGAVVIGVQTFVVVTSHGLDHVHDASLLTPINYSSWYCMGYRSPRLTVPCSSLVTPTIGAISPRNALIKFSIQAITVDRILEA